jgi:CHAD domain-containing protein
MFRPNYSLRFHRQGWYRLVAGGWWAAANLQRQLAWLSLMEQADSHALARQAKRLDHRWRQGLASNSDRQLRRAVQAYHDRLRDRIAAAVDDEMLFSQPKRWHALRLDCKRWRYVLENHGSVWGEAARQAMSHAKALQDALGELRDIELLAESLLCAGPVAPALATQLLNTRDARQIVVTQALARMQCYLAASGKPGASQP